MKKLILGILMLLSFVSIASAQYVSGYFKSNGTYVAPYQRSESNYTVKDNYSYQGNTNPWTGKVGTVKEKNWWE